MIENENEADKEDAAAEPEVNVEGAENGESPQGEAEEAPPPVTELTVEEKIAALEAEKADLKDQYLRKAADFENFRKRMSKEKQDAIDFANQSLLLDIIPVVDDFDRALEAAGSSQKTEKDFDTLTDGIKMIESRLLSQLENKWQLKRFESKGEVFDPAKHEALMMEKSAEVTESIVTDDFQKGYTLRDRVIRSAKVKVTMPE
jgi:molecular chaperone GrpE